MTADLVELAKVIGASQLALKVLGPSLEYIGEQLKGLVAQRARRIGKILDNAQSKLGDRINQPGRVPPRVLKELVQEASWYDDELSLEYFGGVLASSRSEIPRDDRGACMLSIISRMSAYQIRAHYIFYSLIKKVFGGTHLNLADSQGRAFANLYVPVTSFNPAMDFSAEENAPNLTAHVLFGLGSQQLIGKTYSFVDSARLGPRFESDGVIIQPSPLGCELHLWAHGRGDVEVGQYLSDDVLLPELQSVSIPAGARSAPPS